MIHRLTSTCLARMFFLSHDDQKHYYFFSNFLFKKKLFKIYSIKNEKGSANVSTCLLWLNKEEKYIELQGGKKWKTKLSFSYCKKPKKSLSCFVNSPISFKFPASLNNSKLCNNFLLKYSQLLKSYNSCQKCPLYSNCNKK